MSDARIPTRVRRLLVSAANAADLRSSAARCGCSREAQDEMALYLETWVVARIDRALAWADDGDAQEAAKYEDHSAYAQGNGRGFRLPQDECFPHGRKP